MNILKGRRTAIGAWIMAIGGLMGLCPVVQAYAEAVWMIGTGIAMYGIYFRMKHALYYSDSRGRPDIRRSRIKKPVIGGQG